MIGKSPRTVKALLKSMMEQGNVGHVGGEKNASLKINKKDIPQGYILFDCERATKRIQNPNGCILQNRFTGQYSAI